VTQRLGVEKQPLFLKVKDPTQVACCLVIPAHIAACSQDLSRMEVTVQTTEKNIV
jgi:hypothetical protein